MSLCDPPMVKWAPYWPGTSSHKRNKVTSDRGLSQEDLSTICHVVACDPPSGGKPGQDDCISDGGSPLATCCRLGIDLFWGGLSASFT
jgi:hypothetical protein